MSHLCHCLSTQGYLEKGIQTPVAQGRSTKIIPMIMWTRAGRLSIKISLSLPVHSHQTRSHPAAPGG